MLSTTPYFIRALHEWCCDQGETPHIVVAVSAQTRVPMQFVKEGEIVLNIGASAVQRLMMDNDSISFSARFGGVPQELYIPVSRIKAIYSRESGTGMMFEVDDTDDTPNADIEENNKKDSKSTLQPGLRLVK